MERETKVQINYWPPNVCVCVGGGGGGRRYVNKVNVASDEN